MALRRRGQPHSHLPNGKELPARHDRTPPRLYRHHGFFGGGHLPSEAAAPYAAAKAGIVMFSRHVANEVGRHGVRVNCLAPAGVLTERMKRQMPEAAQRRAAAKFPLGRMGAPEDVGLATLFLASDGSSWLTGVTLDVAGGRIMI